MLKLRKTEQLRAGIYAICQRYITNKNSAASQKLQLAIQESEYTEEPEYPPIKDNSFKARKNEEKLTWHEQIKNAKTIEEKMIKINMPRYYGYKTVMLSDEKLPYNCLPATQHYTRTLMDSVSKTASTAQVEAYVSLAEQELQDALEYAYDYFKSKQPNINTMSDYEREKAWSQLVVEQVHRVVTNVLLGDVGHLQEIEVDYNPRHEAFWSVGGIDAPKNVIKSKEGREWQKDMAKDEVDRWMQYMGNPFLAVRHKQQLPAWRADYENMDLVQQLPRYKYDPRTLGYVTGYRHGTNVPGYWPSASSAGFPHLSYQSSAHLKIPRVNLSEEDKLEILKAQAIQSSYAWLLAQANYYGFNTFNELTYPLNTQTIITNGQQWSFYEYQLNTLLVHGLQINTNPRVNFCRSVAEETPMSLYDAIDMQSGKIVGGLNKEVIRNLIEFYAKAPAAEQKSLQQLMPYLDANLRRAADYEDASIRAFLEKTYKHMVSNRPRHLALPEIYMWEKIYKIDHKTKQMDAKRRYFELGINPWQRTLDQHQKEYIPKSVRPEGPKSRKKWKPTYYP